MTRADTGADDRPGHRDRRGHRRRGRPPVRQQQRRARSRHRGRRGRGRAHRQPDRPGERAAPPQPPRSSACPSTARATLPHGAGSARGHARLRRALSLRRARIHHAHDLRSGPQPARRRERGADRRASRRARAQAAATASPAPASRRIARGVRPAIVHASSAGSLDIPEHEVRALAAPRARRDRRARAPGRRGRSRPRAPLRASCRKSVHAMFIVGEQRRVAATCPDCSRSRSPSARRAGASASIGGSLRLAQEVVGAGQQHRDRSRRRAIAATPASSCARGDRRTARRTPRRAPRLRGWRAGRRAASRAARARARPRTRAASARGVKPMPSQNASTASASPLSRRRRDRSRRRPGRRRRRRAPRIPAAPHARPGTSWRCRTARSVGERARDAQALQLACQVEPVARLDLDRGDALGHASHRGAAPDSSRSCARRSPRASPSPSRRCRRLSRAISS